MRENQVDDLDGQSLKSALKSPIDGELTRIWSAGRCPEHMPLLVYSDL